MKVVRKITIIVLISIIVLIVLISVPLLMALLLEENKFSFARGKVDSWITFWGSYIGAALGVLGVYLSTTYQIKKNKKSDKQRYIRDTRSYILFQEFEGNYELKNIHMDFNSFLVLTENYLKHKGESEFIFYKIKHVGKPDVIFNIEIVINYNTVYHETNPNDKHYIQALERNIEVFIPLNVVDLGDKISSYATSVIIRYETISGEKLKYVYDPLIGFIAQYSLQKGKYVEIYKNNITETRWLHPAKTK